MEDGLHNIGILFTDENRLVTKNKRIFFWNNNDHAANVTPLTHTVSILCKAMHAKLAKILQQHQAPQSVVLTVNWFQH